MRFLYIKNEQICGYCRSPLSYGEEAVVLRIKHRNGAIIPVFFHTDRCYELWNNETFVSRLLRWRETATQRPKRKKTPKKMGRPRKYSNPTLARRLKALLWYHKKAGNLERATQIQTEVVSLESNPTDVT